MSPQMWIGIIASAVLLGFIINAIRLMRGPPGHAQNAGMLQAGISVLVLPIMWMIVFISSP